jgi:REP element-mobilizing transposase RayT
MKVEFNNLYTHFIFTTAGRLPVIVEESRDRIEKYMTGIVAKQHCKMYSIYANPEHVHFLVSRSPKISEESLATIVADSTQRFINNNRLTREMFSWQESCAAFSVSKSDVDKVCKYILNQPEHHRRISFAEEYDKMMKFYLTGARWG